MPGKTLRKGSLAELKATNVPKMYQPSAKASTIKHRLGRQTRRNFSINRSAIEAKEKAAQRRLLTAAHIAFPAATPELYAIEKKRASHIRKWRKGKGRTPREIKLLRYKGPKLSPVGEEAEEMPLAGGMERPVVGAVGKRTRRKRSQKPKLESFLEETEKEVIEAAKGAARAPTLSDLLKDNPDYPELHIPRTRRRSKRKVLDYAPSEKLGVVAEGGKRKTRRRRRC